MIDKNEKFEIEIVEDFVYVSYFDEDVISYGFNYIEDNFKSILEDIIKYINKKLESNVNDRYTIDFDDLNDEVTLLFNNDYVLHWNIPIPRNIFNQLDIIKSLINYINNVIKNNEDKVNKPSHYDLGDFEVIDVMKAVLTEEQLHGYYKGNAIKYLLRSGRKGDEITDLKKCKKYLEWLIDE